MGCEFRERSRGHDLDMKVVRLHILSGVVLACFPLTKTRRTVHGQGSLRLTRRTLHARQTHLDVACDVRMPFLSK